MSINARFGEPLLRLSAISKAHGQRHLFEGIEFELARGEFAALKGESGSGKSSLLNVIAGLDAPTSGAVFFKGQNITQLSRKEQARFRSQSLGFVFQAFHLLTHLDLQQNVAIPLLLLKTPLRQAMERAETALASVGMSGRGRENPGKLSGGEQQRVALARALVHKPELLLADEPTGNLDETNAAQALELLANIAKDQGCAVLMVTHSDAAASIAQKVFVLKNQRIQVLA